MNIPDDGTNNPSQPRRRIWLFALPVLAVLVWAGARAAHPPHGWRQSLREFRGEASSDTGPNSPMASALIARHFLLAHPRSKLSLSQSAQLVGYISSPVDEQSQSEALDVLSMAQRENALSPQQAQTAQMAAISVLSTHPAPMVRLESARFLGHLGGSRGIPTLTALQRDDADPKVRDAARQALARCGKSQDTGNY